MTDGGDLKVTRTVEYDLDATEVDTPVSFYVVNVGGHAKVTVPDDSPLNDLPVALSYSAMAEFFGTLSDMLNRQAVLAAMEDVQDY